MQRCIDMAAVLPALAGCGADVQAQDFHDTACNECGGVCRACEACAAGSARQTSAACIDPQLPLLAAYIRRCTLAKLN